MPDTRTNHHRGWALAVVCAATFMLLLDLTIVAVALSDIQAEFHAGLSSLQWVIDAYTLPLAGLLLTAATIGDRIGRRRMFLAGMAVFTFGSLACAVAWSPLVLDLTRALQGVGGALLFGVGLPVIAAAYPEPKARAGAIGAFGATLAGATAVGPLVGGALVDGPGWRWIFLINLPIGAVALVVAYLRLGESRAERARAADWPGTALLTSGLLLLLLALIRGNGDGWTSVRIVGLFWVAGLLLVGFLIRELLAAEPLLDLRLFRSPSFSGIALAVFVMSGTIVASTSYLGLYMVNTLGYRPFDAGLRFLPLTVAAFVAAPVVARFGYRVPTRYTVGGGLAFIGIGMGLAARLDGDSRWTVLLAGFIVAGLGLGAVSAATSQAALSAVEQSRAGMATGVTNTMRQIGVASGVAVLGAVFQRRTTAEMADRLTNGPLTPASAARLADAVGSGLGLRALSGMPEAARALLATAVRTSTATALDEILVGGALVAGAASVGALILIRRESPVPDGLTAVPMPRRDTTRGTVYRSNSHRSNSPRTVPAPPPPTPSIIRAPNQIPPPAQPAPTSTPAPAAK